MQVFSVDMGRVLAGASNRGEFEERLINIVDEVEKSEGVIILFIDEVHTLIGAGAGEQALDAANILKPALARGVLKVGLETWFWFFSVWVMQYNLLSLYAVHWSYDTRRIQKIH